MSYLRRLKNLDNTFNLAWKQNLAWTQNPGLEANFCKMLGSCGIPASRLQGTGPSVSTNILSKQINVK